LKALEQALDRVGGMLQAEIHFQPFELNPQMAPEGQDLYEHMAQKYGSTREQSEQNREMIRARGAELGFDFRMDRLERIYNTFDTHRLLHWAGIEGCQKELKHALFDAYFTQGENPGAHDVLVRVAATVGLNPERAQALLDSDDFAAEVRTQQQFYQSQGIHAVPAVIINGRHLIQGGQPVEMFERALRQIAQESVPAN
jgi:predicted DsbA family dithiol-disulfide isomerase